MAQAGILPGPVVETEWLAAHADQVQIVEVRSNIKSYTARPEIQVDAKGKKTIEEVGGHIPGALLANFRNLRVDRIINGQKVQFMIPEAADFQAYVRQTGVLAGKPIVLVPIGAEVGDAMERRFGASHCAEHFRTFDTICSATQDRQDAVVTLLRDQAVDLMLVIGGYNSSNTVNLVRICAESRPTFHIADPECLLSLETIRKEIEGRTVFREKVQASVDIPFSLETKHVLQYAADEADRLLHTYIGTEHLLLGILREERSVAVTLLYEKGMRLASVRRELQQLLLAASGLPADIRCLPIGAMTDPPPARLPDRVVDPSAPAFIVTTSGSTARSSGMPATAKPVASGGCECTTACTSGRWR